MNILISNSKQSILINNLERLIQKCHVDALQRDEEYLSQRRKMKSWKEQLVMHACDWFFGQRKMYDPAHPYPGALVLYYQKLLLIASNNNWDNIVLDQRDFEAIFPHEQPQTQA